MAKGYSGKDHQAAVNWEEAQKNNTKDLSVKQMLNVVHKPDSSTYADEISNMSKERVNYMETLHFLAMQREALDKMPHYLAFMREKGVAIAPEHNHRHQLRKALGVLWGTISDEIRHVDAILASSYCLCVSLLL